MALMKPTIPWMVHTFNEYNEKYFHGRLRAPKFRLGCPKNDDWGCFRPDGVQKGGVVTALYSTGTLFLNGQYMREEKDWIGTMLHEMIHMYIINVDRKYPMNGHGREFQEWANFLNRDGWNISEFNEKKSTDVETAETQNDERSYDERLVKPYIFCIINQPQDNNYKLWGFKADYNTLNNYIDTARKLKQNGAVSVYVYYCYSGNMRNLQTSASTLMGVGGNSFNELIRTLSRAINEHLTQDNFKLYKEIKL